MSDENGSDYFFEGVEKLLEVWFKSSNSVSSDRNDLRLITKKMWQNVLESVECQIIDVTQNKHQIAYILSESSLFVTKDRVILKTCGTTMCLQALKHIIKLASDQCGLDIINDCFYSRRNFSKPDKQPHPHKTFEQETSFLEAILPGGASYCLGSLNRNRWYLWTLNHNANPSSVGVDRPDQTLEILMHDLHPDVCKLFYKKDPVSKCTRSAEEITQKSGIGDLIEGSTINSYVFDPCGYSMNGILGKDEYWTIHITPEENFSYASFETNVPINDYDAFISKVMKVFRPARFCMTLFWNELSNVDTEHWIKGPGPSIDGVKCINTQLTRLQNYFLLYSDHTRKVQIR